MAGPSGQQITLLNQPCGGDDDIDVVFDDELGAELVCSANPPSVSGILRPSSGSLSSFNEQSTKGDWVLVSLIVMILMEAVLITLLWKLRLMANGQIRHQSRFLK